MNSDLINLIKKTFIDKYKSQPLLIFSPGRINLIGEHTDYNDGYVFPAAIDKGIIAAIAITNSNLSTIYALDKRETLQISLTNIRRYDHGSWQNYILGVIAELQNMGKEMGNFNMVFGGDIPEGAGMSSSAALENSMVFGLNELFNFRLTKNEMILVSQKAEHNYVGVKCGIMDQFASMFGVNNSALLLDCRRVTAKPFEIDFQDYELVFINTNVKHSLSESAYNDRRLVCETISNLLKIRALRDAQVYNLKSIKGQVSSEDYQKALYVIQENNRVISASKAIEENDLESLGKLMYASHEGLKNQYKVSCDELDFLVEQARKNPNILGARMMGGGFGGCTINLILKSETPSFKAYITQAYKKEFNKTCSIYSVNLFKGTHLIKYFS